jgi:hypothetical protein
MSAPTALAACKQGTTCMCSHTQMHNCIACTRATPLPHLIRILPLLLLGSLAPHRRGRRDRRRCSGRPSRVAWPGPRRGRPLARGLAPPLPRGLVAGVWGAGAVPVAAAAAVGFIAVVIMFTAPCGAAAASAAAAPVALPFFLLVIAVAVAVAVPLPIPLARRAPLAILRRARMSRAGLGRGGRWGHVQVLANRENGVFAGC